MTDATDSGAGDDATGTEAAPRCYRHPDRETWVSCQRCGRPICPQCQTQAAVGVHCPECVREGRESTKGQTPAFLRALRPSGRPIVTYTLIGLCVVIYGLQFVSRGALTQAWFLDPTQSGAEPWRLLTSVFLHSPANILHLLFNMYALYVFGPVLERFLGRARLLALYLIGGLGGSVAVVSIYELWIVTQGGITQATGGFITPISALGASGAIFALMGALIALRKALGIQLQQLLIVLAINLAVPFFIPNVAWQAHIGGLLIGLAIGAVYARTRRPEAQTRQIVGVGGIAVGLIAIVGLFVATAPAFYL